MGAAAGGVRLVRRTVLALVFVWAGPVFAADGERVALVVGNAAYPSAPLANPRNDAEAMSRLLTEAGFAVDLRVDTTLDSLRSAVAQFGQKIKDPKVKFAVFYYAGHGVQLDWRNYLIPVSARIRGAADVRTNAVDASDLLKYMGEGKSKNYVMILDACRDDPFGAAYRPPYKGLSQFNAPPGGVLAYSTAPGKVALDGGGENGLYTAYLLKEFSVKGVKIEDAFKRTRLNVRLASKGRQVPWETTSLEEDLYLFPSPVKKLTDAERERLLEEELREWAKVKATTDVMELAEFIRKYPSGNVSELAASRMNRLLAQHERREERVMASRSESLRDAEQERAKLEAAIRAAAENAERAKAEAARAEAVREMAARLERELQQALQLQMANEEAARRRAQAQEAQRQRDAQVAAEEAERQRLATQRQAEQVALAARQEAERARLEREARERAQAAAEAAQREQALRAELARKQLEQERLAREQAQTPTPGQQPGVAVAAAGTAAQPANQAESAPDAGAEVVAATPFFDGSSANLRRYAVGDEYNFRILDPYSKVQRSSLAIRVTAADPAADRVEFNGGEYVADLMGNILRNVRGTSSTPRQFYPAELVVGKRWVTRFKQVRPNVTYTFAYELKVVGKERITVPAGTFDTYKIEARGANVDLGATIERNIWVAPGVNADIAHETKVVLRRGGVDEYDRQELVSFKQAAPVPSTAVVAR